MGSVLNEISIELNLVELRQIEFNLNQIGFN
jgi:hypothetical protein